jgi:tetratricopeptide (TPR) repeat protein/DNA-binding XRE family transcriptional regulator
MESFSQLLNQFVQRSGISDAELARAVGVSRQTIFRWREGQTGRPRQREDILVMARKLRLAPEERDLLLLAAGFQPEQITTPVHNAIETSVTLETKPAQNTARENRPEEKISADISSTPRGDRWSRRWLAMALAALLLFTGGLAWWASQAQLNNKDGLKSTTTLNTDLSLYTPAVTPAAAGETVVLVTHFANYASSQVGYNVAGRLAEALQREIEDLRLQDSRVTIWSQVVAEHRQALEAGQAVSATLVIYGEYDVGRVVVKFAHPANQTIFSDPALQRYVADPQELSAAINSDLPQQVRSLALMALGQIYLIQDEADRARPLLVQARHNLENDSTVGRETWALVNFHLGLAYQLSQPPVLDEAIRAYTEAVESWPELVSARLNRIAAYETRGQPGDLQLALGDADAVVAAAPEWGVAYLSRASIRMSLGGVENLALALADLEKALALEPELPEAYYNRAYVQWGQGLPIRQVEPDLKKALDLRPNYGAALNLLCWGYAVEQQPDIALPYCQQAVAADPGRPEFQDSRGLAYALSGNYAAAIVDFESYAAWLKNKKPGEAWQAELAQRSDWIKALTAGKNPFTPLLLAELRRGFGQ